MKKISVIMPIYNAEKYLHMALDSLLQQTLTDIEIICVDDGSTDHSLQILKQFQEKDSRIIILQQKNSYAGVARNYGMTIATGKYLSFLDADDYFRPDMLERAYVCAEKECADVTVFAAEKFENDLENAWLYSSALREALLPGEVSVIDNKNKFEYIFNITIPAPWNKLFLREFVERNKLQFQPYKRINDAYFVEMAMVLSNRVGIVHEPLLCYRVGNSASLQGGNSETPLQFPEVLLDIKKRLQELNLYERVEKSFRNLCLNCAIYALESLKDVNAFETLYEALKDNLFQQFGIEGTAREEYFSAGCYDRYISICSNPPILYWMELYNKLLVKKEKQYLFPFQLISKNADIVLYGAGKVGKSYFKQIMKSGYCNLTVWVDKRERQYGSYSIIKPENNVWWTSEYILIAIEKETVAEQIRMELHEKYGIPLDRMIWANPVIDE